MLVTASSADLLAGIARTLVDESLAACVMIVPTVRSIYRWQGAVEDESEALGLIKTTSDRYTALEARIAELHPYDVPELLALPVVAGLPEYLEWLRSSTDTPG